MGLLQKIFGTHSENELKRIYPIVDEIEDDFQKTLAKSHKVTLMEVKHQTLFTKITGQVLRLFAPLM